MSTKISATIVADSICNGHRITTMKVTFPRNILAEAKTHRVMKHTDGGMEVYDIPGIGFNDDEMLSRNSASSRAIPFNKMVQAVMDDPFIPIAWQKDHKGMQGTEYFTDPEDIGYLVKNHLAARSGAAAHAEYLYHQGVTKQICNRYLEPFMWHTVLVTATEWENFFHLRCPQYVTPHGTFRSIKDIALHCKEHVGDYYQIGDRRYLAGMEATFVDALVGGLNKGQAEIHMMALAEAMWDARNESKPKELQPGGWHIPYGDNIRFGLLEQMETPTKVEYPTGKILDSLDFKKVKIATARAARTSYTVVGEEGKPHDYKKDIELHDRLLESGHMSPFEHCVQAMTEEEFYGSLKGTGILTQGDGDSVEVETIFKPDAGIFGWCHNLRGWKSYRSMIPNENRR